MGHRTFALRARVLSKFVVCFTALQCHYLICIVLYEESVSNVQKYLAYVVQSSRADQSQTLMIAES